MAIKASVFFLCCAIIGMGFIGFGCDALKQTTLPTSVAPAVLFLVKHFLTIATSHSITYTLIFRTQLNIHVVYYYALFAYTVSPAVFASISGQDTYFNLFFPANVILVLKCILRFDFWGNIPFLRKRYLFIIFSSLLVLLLAITSFEWVLLLSLFANGLVFPPATYAAIDGESDCLVFHSVTMLGFLMFGSSTKHFSAMLVLFTTFLTCVAHATISGDERFQGWKRWMPAATVQENWVFSRLKEFMMNYWTAGEYVIGMGAAILFQYYFKLTSFDHVLVFIYFAVAWLANLAILFCSHDLGVFKFLVTNVIMGSIISEYGVGWTTWFALGVSVILVEVRRRLNLLCVVRRDNGVAVISWRQNETEETGLQEIEVLDT